MLVRNDNICTLRNSEISVEVIFDCFFEIKSNIIYIVDEGDLFVGVITSGAFLNNLKNNQNIFVNTDCSMIIEKDDTDVLEEAETLFRIYHITTAIPVLDLMGKICYEIREERVDCTQEILADFNYKFKRYEKSNYVRQEIIYLQNVLENQDITVIGTERRFDEICGEVFRNRERITFIDKVGSAYDLIYHNKNLLIDVSLSGNIARKDIYKVCNIGYGWEEFFHTIMYIIECEYASRFYRIIKKESDIVKEHIEKYWGRDVIIPLKGIFTAEIKKYLEKNRFNVHEYKKGICKEEYYQIDYRANGVTCKTRLAKDLMLLDCIDHILHFYDLNQCLVDRKVSVLNFVFDTDAYIMDTENNRMLDAEYDFHKYVLENEEKKLDIDSLYYGNNDGIGYIRELEQSSVFYPVKRFENDLVVFKDHKSKFVNIENGLRKTCYQPEEYLGTIYFLGPCTMYGHFVEDLQTIPSLVQRHISELGKKYRVVNLGNQIQTDVSRLIDVLDLRKTDIFIVLFPSIVETIEKKFPVIEIGKRFNQLRLNKYQGKECFLDGVYHCGNIGNIIFGEIIFSEIEKYLNEGEQKDLCKNNIYTIFKRNEMDLGALYDWDRYVNELRIKKKMVLMEDAKIGCIVMNCNPFTKGHRYLIECALTNVDYLYIFVVEEEKSFFDFKNRYEMVIQGTHDLENVFVIRSGKLIISSATFPAYFQKDKEGIINEISVNEDLRIFAQYIAPVLNIQYRFVGEEPQDYVTSCYNDAMKKILPQFDIHVTEIPRKSINDEIISASIVRKYYLRGDFQRLKLMFCRISDFYL